jgi:hypothetical protein
MSMWLRNSKQRRRFIMDCSAHRLGLEGVQREATQSVTGVSGSEKGRIALADRQEKRLALPASCWLRTRLILRLRRSRQELSLKLWSTGSCGCADLKPNILNNFYTCTHEQNSQNQNIITTFIVTVQCQNSYRKYVGSIANVSNNFTVSMLNEKL